MIKPAKQALVVAYGPGDSYRRPALFVYDTPDGFAWVEASYLDPWNTMPAFHRRTGAMHSGATGFRLAGGDGLDYWVEPLAMVETDDMRDALIKMKAAVEDQGTTLDDEREHVKQLLGNELR